MAALEAAVAAKRREVQALKEAALRSELARLEEEVSKRLVPMSELTHYTSAHMAIAALMYV